MQVTLSIIIVNYRTPDLLLNCLKTVFQDIDAETFEVIVVDNASGDRSEEVITKEFPLVKWIGMTDNAGFARANNAGIRVSTGGLILLLNSDTLVHGNAISDSARLLSQSQYLFCGVSLLNADGSFQISGNYFTTGGLNNLLPLPYLGNLFRWLGRLGGVATPHAVATEATQEVDWINGAYLMLKREAIAKAGLMDEDFFLYAEEAEWCARIRKFGKGVVYPDLRVTHLQGASSNTTFSSESQGYHQLHDRKGLQIMLSNFVRIRKQWGSGWFLLQLIIYTFDIPITVVGDLITGKNLQFARGYAGNILRIWKLLIPILRNKPFFYKVL